MAVELKSKVHPRTGHEGPERESKYSSTLSLTSALDGVGGQRPAPAVSHPGKTRHSLYRRLVGPQGRFGQVRKTSPLPELDSRTVQPVANRYTAWAIRQTYIKIKISVTVQQDATIHSLLYFCKLLYMFRVVNPPIIRSTYNCNYGIRHWSNCNE
jgi:hypothetical protein